MIHAEALLLSAFADGELAPEERARVQGHLLYCEGCRLALAELRQTKVLLACATRRAMPPDLVAAIEARLARRAGPWTALRHWAGAPRVWAPASALALAAMAMSLWVGVLSRDPDQYVPLEPLLAAHSRYAAESLVPEDNLVAASYSTLDAAPEQDTE